MNNENVVSKITDVLKRYQTLPRILIIRNSLVEEISNIIANSMSTNDGPKEISDVMKDIDLSDWETISES
jgi:hypothetical protein